MSLRRESVCQSSAAAQHAVQPLQHMVYILLVIFCSSVSWHHNHHLHGRRCRFDPATSDIKSLKRLLTFSSKFVNSLHLEQLPSHLDLQMIFDAMRR